MKKPYYILIDIAFVLAILTVVDLSVGMAADKMLAKLHNNSYYGEINDAINFVTPDVLIIGASTAKSDINPQILIDSLQGETVYNAGRDGMNILFNSCILNAVFRRKIPSTVICVVFPTEFNREYSKTVSVLNPFYGSDSLINATINLKSKFEWLKLKSSLYRYNSILPTIIKGTKSSSNTIPALGYRPLPVPDVKPSVIDDQSIINNPDSICIERFQWLIKRCQKDNVELIVVSSPLLLHYDREQSSIPLISTICSENKIQFLDFSADMYFFNHPELFRDNSHLDFIGADYYSSIIAKYIKN